MKEYNKYLDIGHPNRPGIKLNPRALIIHWTGDEFSSDTGNARWMNRKYIFKNERYYELNGHTKFRYGSAHVFIDENSFTNTIPLDEVAWGCGDRPNDYHNGYKGQTSIAKDIFNNKQNYQTINIEMCNSRNFNKVMENTQEWIKNFIKDKILLWNEFNILPTNINKNELYIFRHFDVTGKICPKPLIDNDKWHDFIRGIFK